MLWAGVHGRTPLWRDCTHLATSSQPFLEAARVLLDRGYDPTTRIVMRHAGSTTDSLASTIGAAAKLTVSNRRFQHWTAKPSDELRGPPMCANAGRLAGDRAQPIYAIGGHAHMPISVAEIVADNHAQGRRSAAPALDLHRRSVSREAMASAGTVTHFSLPTRSPLLDRCALAQLLEPLWYGPVC